MVHLELGDRRFDISTEAVVVGILNRTPDSFFDQGTYFGFDEFLRKADGLVADGADVLDVGGVKAGPGTRRRRTGRTRPRDPGRRGPARPL